MVDIEKKLARLMGTMGIEIPAEDTVSPAAGELEAQMQQSMMSDQAPPDPAADPAAAGGAAPAAGGMPPGGDQIGAMSGIDPMAGAAKAAAVRDKAAAVSAILQRAN
jgi:hypothetical protein